MSDLVYKIISSGSTGNCVFLFERILVDIGVPFSRIKDVYKNVQLLTWSHKHSDHINKETVKRLVFERPSLRIAICEHEYERAVESGCKNIDVLKNGVWYDYGEFQIATFKTYHDCPSNGWRFKYKDFKVFFVTDSFTLEGITAPNYTHYLCESNYDSETVWDKINDRESRGEYAHQRGAINSHLSEQQANEFYFNNRAEHSRLIRLHGSTTSL